VSKFYRLRKKQREKVERKKKGERVEGEGVQRQA
jgi:hypothetical protein